MISVTQRPATVFSISKYFLYIKRGGGGYPPPPLTSFFQVGYTLPPMCRASSGYPPPPAGPHGGSHPHDFWDGPPMIGVSLIFKSPGLPPILPDQKSKENYNTDAVNPNS